MTPFSFGSHSTWSCEPTLSKAERTSEMRTKIFQLDAFTTSRFSGNPAAVMPMDRFLDDATLQAIAAENNLAETAFLVKEKQGRDYRLRWFTPMTEVPLCGHATLASAAVVMERLEPGRVGVTFHTASGPLAVRRSATGYVMDFPARQFAQVRAPVVLLNAIGIEPHAVYANEFNYLAVLDRATEVRMLQPDLAAIACLDRSGLIVTAAGDGDYDFISRYFAPAKGVPEDPVTGGAHCMLAPYWAHRLGKTEFCAWQASARGGEVICRLLGNRVELERSCVFYMEGEVDL